MTSVSTQPAPCKSAPRREKGAASFHGALAGVLPAAVAANAAGHGLICPHASGPEAAWASHDLEVLAPRSLIQLANHFKGAQILGRPAPAMRAAATISS